jgi:hypothetical protein
VPMEGGRSSVPTSCASRTSTATVARIFSKFECAGTVPPQPFCGSGGCSLSIYLWAGGSTWQKALDETVQTFRFVKQNGRPALRVELGGSACGKVNARSCPQTFVFEGAKLVPARR